MDVNAGRLSLGLSPKAGAVGGRDETDNHVSSRLTENSQGRPHTSRRSQLFNPLPPPTGADRGEREGSRALDQLGHRFATARRLNRYRELSRRIHRIHDPPAAQRSGRNTRGRRISVYIGRYLTCATSLAAGGRPPIPRSLGERPHQVRCRPGGDARSGEVAVCRPDVRLDAPRQRQYMGIPG
jgi:hypothetical protein